VKVDVAITEAVWEVKTKVGDIFLTILHSEETDTKLNVTLQQLRLFQVNALLCWKLMSGVAYSVRNL